MAVNNANWAHADWDKHETVEDRLVFALQHAAEVRQAVVETGSGKGRYQRLPAEYLRDLDNQISEMRNQIRAQEAKATRTAAARCPVNLRPRF